MTFHKRGPKAWIIDRLKRIGLPLVVGWPTSSPRSRWPPAMRSMSRPDLRRRAAGPAAPPGAFPLTHLWFLYAPVALRRDVGDPRPRQTFDWSGDFGRRVDGAVAALVRSPLSLVCWRSRRRRRAHADLARVVRHPDAGPEPRAQPAGGRSSSPRSGSDGAASPAGAAGTWTRRWALTWRGRGPTVHIHQGLTPVRIRRPGEHIVWLRLCACIWTWTFGVIGAACGSCRARAACGYIADSSYWIYVVTCRW